MLRSAAIPALVLLASCAPTPRPGTPRALAPRTGVGVLVNATRGRCTWITDGERRGRVCLPRGKAPQPSDSVGTDSSSTER